jgi:peptidoglycan/LPS O-acetylase OafA/YrhL
MAGALSYSLYIWQQLFLPPRAAGIWQRAPWSLASVFVCAATSYYVVERPLIAFGRRLVSEPRSRISRKVSTGRRWERQIDRAGPRRPR